MYEAKFITQRISRAPNTRAPGSYAWFDVQFTPQGPVINPEQAEASRRLLLRFIGEAVAAYGAFIAPVVIGAQIKAGTPQTAMYGFAIFYALCLVLNWWFYLRSNAYVKNP